jgi:putative SOS response-associated peptidase YedK
MCNLYHVSPKGDFATYIARHAERWMVPDYDMRTVGPNQDGVFFRAADADVVGQVGQWGMIRPGQPERVDYLPSKVPGKRGRPRSTNNARIEGIEKKVTFKAAWTSCRRCLVPAAWYQEPNWETGKNIWWQLKRADGSPWMLAGLWSEWTDLETGEVVPNFTMLTTNCDTHHLLNRLHKPDPELPADAQDKRSLVHVAPANWEQWLRGNVDEALQLVQPPPAEDFDLADAIKTDKALASLGR